jgi:hypothetical protein
VDLIFNCEGVVVIVTKQELNDILFKVFDKTILNAKSLYEKFIDVLEWHDDEPRDITNNDIMLVEDLIAVELDLLLTTLEEKCFKKPAV